MTSQDGGCIPRRKKWIWYSNSTTSSGIATRRLLVACSRATVSSCLSCTSKAAADEARRCIVATSQIYNYKLESNCNLRTKTRLSKSGLALHISATHTRPHTTSGENRQSTCDPFSTLVTQAPIPHQGSRSIGRLSRCPRSQSRACALTLILCSNTPIMRRSGISLKRLSFRSVSCVVA